MNDIKRALEELIAALDRRVPQVHHAGEEMIARESAALRARAVNRLAELVGNFEDSEDRPIHQFREESAHQNSSTKRLPGGLT